MESFKPRSGRGFAVGTNVGKVFVTIRHLERRMMHSTLLARIPARFRMLILLSAKAVLLAILVVLTTSIVVMIGGLVLFSWIPQSVFSDEAPSADDLDHPLHRTHFPEFYDEYGSLK